MMLSLQRYDLKVIYKKGSEMVLAGTFARAYLPVKVFDQHEEQFEQTHAVEKIYKISDERMT